MHARRRRSVFTFLFFVSILVITSSSTTPASAAGPWYVAPGGSDSNDCDSIGAPCETIDGAIGKATAGDMVYVADGVYTGTGPEVVLINKGITLSGGWDPTFAAQTGLSTIDGENARRGITINWGFVVELEHLLVIHGSTGSSGGGISAGGGALTIRESYIFDNYAYAGGGGITTSSASLTLFNSSVSNNYSSQWGGGIYTNCSDLYLNNSTISENLTDSGGGGILHSCDTEMEIYSSSIVGNAAIGYEGGGIRTFTGASIHNSIIAGNSSVQGGDDCWGTVTSLGYNILGDIAGCTITATSGDQFDTDPLVGPVVGQPGFNPLSAVSPAINAGNSSGCTNHLGDPITADQRGFPRSGICDIGAYEYVTPGTAAEIYYYSGSEQRALPNDTFPDVLTVFVLDDQGTPVDGIPVDFAAPASGPSGIFADTSTHTSSAITDAYGFGQSPAFTANGESGNYTVQASVSGIPTIVDFDLFNALWYASPYGSGTNDCLSPSTPCWTVETVYNKPDFLPGDTILLEGAVYTGAGTADLSNDVILKGGWNSSFTLQDGYTTFDGGGSDRVVSIPADTVVEMERFIIQNGAVTAANGAGIANSGDLTITDCFILNNSTTNSGGGISNVNGSTVMSHCTISGNTSSATSAVVYNSGGQMSIADSLIENNSGGGIYGWDFLIRRTVIHDNDGAGLKSSGNVEIINSVISGNSGAGIDGQGVHMYNTTVANNDGTGVVQFGAPIELENSIVSGNNGSSGPDCSGVLTSQGYNLITNMTGCTILSASGDLLGVEGDLEPLAGSPPHHPLLSESLAMNAGDPSGCKDHSDAPIDFDIRGFSRWDRCDMGSYEAQSYKTVDEDKAMPGDTLSYTIRLQNGLPSSQSYTVTDTLPTGLTYVTGSLSATQGTPNYSAGVITWSDSAASCQDVTLTFDAEIGDVAGEITNTAEIDNSIDLETRSATICVDAPVCSVTKYTSNPVLTVGAPGSWDDDGVWHPSVLLDGATYKMWYAGNDDTYVNHIGLATSPDGYDWAKEGSNPVLSVGAPGSWDEDGVSRPSVLLDGSTYKMWFTGVNSSGLIQIGYATSPDGVVWTKHPSNPVLLVGAASSWDDDDVTGPTVLKEDGTYHMWYAGNDGATFRIGHATSSDGIAWAKDPANPVLDLGPTGAWDWLGIYSPDVVKIGDSYKMWYSGETLPQAWQTGYAESDDGTTWTRKSMLIPEGPPGTFDTNSADHPAVLVDGASYRIWYAGIDDSNTYTIGHAEAQLCTGGAYTLYLPLVMKDYSPGPACPPDYLDDFSDPGSGWLIYEDADVKYDYTGGEYQLWAKNADSGWLVTPGAKASDFTVAVSARRMSGTYGAYGIVFGISDDWLAYYEVLIDDAYFSIWRYDGAFTPLKDWTYSGDISTGLVENRLKVTREGSNISVYINDAFQTTISDGALLGWRRIGLAAASSSSAPMDFRFDDFALYPASCGPTAADTLGIEWGEAEAHPAVVPPKPEPSE